MGNATTATPRLNRIAEWLTKPGTLRPLQLKTSQISDKPLAAKGGPKITIRDGDNVLEYRSGFYKTEGRITPEAQEALDAKLLALVDVKEKATAKAMSAYDAAVTAAKASYQAAMDKARIERDSAMSSAASVFDKAALEAVTTARGGQ
jgi:hypothetical protein